MSQPLMYHNKQGLFCNCLLFLLLLLLLLFGEKQQGNIFSQKKKEKKEDKVQNYNKNQIYNKPAKNKLVVPSGNM